MRLTLRTLLAYMDDILDPADQEELGRKIESSPFATELIHRSRDTVRRVRLGAPEVLSAADDDIHGADTNFDANTVAEYLDNVSPPDAVAEFERSCLEPGPNADMLLAEAASCHHILTMVLGEPAEVDGDLRQRMYGLSQSPAAAQQLRVEPAHHAPPEMPPVAAAAATPLMAAAPLSTVVTVSSSLTPAPRSVDDEDEVPDYIRAAARERRRNRQLIGVFVASMLAFAAAGLWLFWPQGEVRDPGDVAALGGSKQVAQGPEIGPTTNATTTDAAAATDSASTAAGPVDPDSEAPAFVPGTSATGSPAEPTGSTAVEATPPAPPVEAAVGAMTADASGQTVAPPTSGATPPTPPATTGGESAAGTAAPGVAALAPALEGGPAGPAAATPPAPTEAQVADAPGAVDADSAAPNDPADPATTAGGAAAMSASAAPQLPPEPPMADDAGATAPAEPAAGPNLIADAATTPPADAAAPAAPTQPAASAAAGPTPPKPIGNYLGNNDMLLRRASDGAWLRMAPRSPLTTGEQLLALPAFRTLIVLADMNVYLTGGALVELIPPGPEPVDAALHIPFGQVILNSGLNGNRLQLALVDHERVLKLAPSSSLAVEVRRIFQPGSMTTRTPAPAEVTWYLTSGTATRNDGTEVQAPAMWTTVAGEDSTPEAIADVPAWVDRDPLSTLERDARERVAEALLANEPVNIKLLELSDKTGLGRRVEVRTLAARSGTYVGVFDPIVRALGDVDQRAFWKRHVETLRDALARDPNSAEAIHAAFAIERGEEAANDLMEMLMGFDKAAVGTTREEVQSGVLLRLLRWMENDDLVYRVLALHNVNEITGTSGLGGYRPEQTAQQRDRAMRFYWQAFENGDLIRKP